MALLTSVYDRLGTARCEFRCCDTTFRAHAVGIRAANATTAVRKTAERLEATLDAFATGSAVSQLNADGSVRDEHVARVVRRGLEYHDRTDRVFDIHQGSVEHSLKAYLRGETESLPETFDTGTVVVDHEYVATDVTLDLNGLAKGYIVDRWLFGGTVEPETPNARDSSAFTRRRMSMPTRCAV
jgi:thiamine biosynthesis lipoprotein